jgi:DNA-binding XRE family transcriptional regulator
MQRGPQNTKDALKRLWPAIGPHCEANGLPLARLLAGQDGVPIDPRKLRDARGAAYLTRKDVASAADLSVDAVTKIENGFRNPTPVTLAALLDAIGCPAADILPDPA